MFVSNQWISSLFTLLDSRGSLTFIWNFSNQIKVQSLSGGSFSFNAAEKISSGRELEFDDFLSWNSSTSLDDKTKKFIRLELINIDCGSEWIIGELLLSSFKDLLRLCVNCHLSVVWLPDNSVEFFDLLFNDDLNMWDRSFEVLQIEKFNTVFLSLSVEVWVHDTQVGSLWMHVELHFSWVFDCVSVHHSSAWEF